VVLRGSECDDAEHREAAVPELRVGVHGAGPLVGALSLEQLSACDRSRGGEGGVVMDRRRPIVARSWDQKPFSVSAVRRCHTGPTSDERHRLHSAPNPSFPLPLQSRHVLLAQLVEIPS
jgi:hypothetical protein